MDKPLIVRGRALRIATADGRLIASVDTDQIFHNAHLHITERAQMGEHAFGNLDGWKDFPKRVRPGDILLVGENFGAGSSRQQAVDCFLALGVAALVGVSFGAIYKRNAINAGLPLVTYPELGSAAVTTGDEIEIDLTSGRAANVTRGRELRGAWPMSPVQLDIYRAGDLFAYAHTQEC